MKLAGGDILLEMHDFGFEETYTVRQQSQFKLVILSNIFLSSDNVIL